MTLKTKLLALAALVPLARAQSGAYGQCRFSCLFYMEPDTDHVIRWRNWVDRGYDMYFRICVYLQQRLLLSMSSWHCSDVNHCVTNKFRSSGADHFEDEYDQLGSYVYDHGEWYQPLFGVPALCQSLLLVGDLRVGYPVSYWDPED